MLRTIVTDYCGCRKTEEKKHGKLKEKKKTALGLFDFETKTQIINLDLSCNVMKSDKNCCTESIFLTSQSNFLS